jgi:hypothetical protein
MTRRVGILTLPLNPNYGFMLQAAALYRFLADHGHHVVWLDKRAPQERGRRLKNRVVENTPLVAMRATARTWVGRRLRRAAPQAYAMAAHRDFLRRSLPDRTGALYDGRQLREAIERRAIDTIVVGSDQVWNYGLISSDGPDTYFCGFLGDRDVRRISYAASFGHDRWGFPDLTDRVRADLATFAAVSVREASGVRICGETMGRRDCVHVVDPTLLLDAALYERMASRAPAPDGPSLVEYVLDAGADKDALTGAALAALDRPLAVRRLSLDAGVGAIDAPGWLAAIRNASFVITDSFHGTVFSIIFRRNFVAVVNRARGADRFVSLLGQLGLGDRLIEPDEIDRVPDLARTPIDFDAAHRRIESLREASAAFLLSALH